MIPSNEEIRILESENRELAELEKSPPVLQRYGEDVKDISKKSKSHKGRPLGFKTLDLLLDGVSSGELIVISAPTNTGKTAFAQSITWKLAQKGIGSLWYSLEVSIWNFLQPFLMNDPKVKLESDGTVSSVGSYPIYWPENVEKLDFDGLKKTIRYAYLKYGIEHIFIDHLHYLIDAKDLEDTKSTSLFIGDRLRKLRKIALETGTSIFLVAHMTKTDDTKDPTVNDLRDSSFIGQEADAVIMLYRKRLKNPVKQSLPDGTEYEITHSPIAKCKLDKARRTGNKGSFDLVFDRKMYHDPNDSPTIKSIYEIQKNIYEPLPSVRPKSQ